MNNINNTKSWLSKNFGKNETEAFYSNDFIVQKTNWYNHCELNYHDLKICRTPVCNIRKHWTAFSTLLGRISSVCHDILKWRSNQWPQNAELKLYLWPINLHHTQVMRSQLVMVILRPNNLKVSCELHPYSLQRTQ